MNNRNPDLSRIYNNVFGGAGLPANLNGLVQKFKEGSSKGRPDDIMGCTWSGLTALYDAVNIAEDVYINGRRFKIVKGLGEGGYAFVYLVREVGQGLIPYSAGGRSSQEGSNRGSEIARRNLSPDGTYAMKKFLIQTREQFQMVKAEIATAKQFDHPNLLPLLEHEIVGAKAGKEAYLLFPVYRDGTLQDHIAWMTESQSDYSGGSRRRNQRFSASLILKILIQVASGLHHMHTNDPPFAHNDIKPGNVLISLSGSRSSSFRDADTAAASSSGNPSGSSGSSGAVDLFGNQNSGPAGWVSDLEAGGGGPGLQPSTSSGATSVDATSAVKVAIMDFGSATPARREIRSRGQALSLQEWAEQHASAGYRAPEFFDCPSNVDIDERSDIWSLGCMLYALMYGLSPFEHALGESGGSVHLAVMSGNVKWPAPPHPPYPEVLHKMVMWMVQLDFQKRPTAMEVAKRAEKIIATLPPDS